MGVMPVSSNFNKIILLYHGDANKLTCRAGHILVRKSGGVKSDETSSVRSDLITDPLLVLRNSGIHTRIIRLSTTIAKTHNASLDPCRALFDDHWTSRVTLYNDKEFKSLSVRYLLVNLRYETKMSCEDIFGPHEENSL